MVRKKRKSMEKPEKKLKILKPKKIDYDDTVEEDLDALNENPPADNEMEEVGVEIKEEKDDF
jgi:hypothetical protein